MCRVKIKDTQSISRETTALTVQHQSICLCEFVTELRKHITLPDPVVTHIKTTLTAQDTIENTETEYTLEDLFVSIADAKFCTEHGLQQDYTTLQDTDIPIPFETSDEYREACNERILAKTAPADQIGERLASLLIQASTGLPEISLETTEIQDWCKSRGYEIESADTQTLNTYLRREAILTAFLNTAAEHAPTHVSPPESIHHDSTGTLTDANNNPDTTDLESPLSTSPFTTVLSEFLTSPPLTEWLRELTTVLETSRDPIRLLSRCYETLLPAEARWREGQFHTPPEVARFLGTFATSPSTDTVLDPGIGTGELARGVLNTSSSHNTTIHPTSITGIEKNPISAWLSSIGIAYLDSEYTENTDAINVYCNDFFEIPPNSLPNSIDSIVMNPPYTKHHELTTDEKSRLSQLLDRVDGFDEDLSRLAPLYAYFTVFSSQFLQPGGTAAFLIPAEILNTEYGTEWKRFIQSEYDITGLLRVTPGSDGVFPGVDTTSLIVLAKYTPNSSVNTSPTACIEIRTLDVLSSITEQLYTLTEAQRTSTEMNSVDPDNTGGVLHPSYREGINDLSPEHCERVLKDGCDAEHITVVTQDTLDPETSWSQYFTGISLTVPDELIEFTEIANISRGISTGQNPFFCLSESDRENTSERFEWDIPTDFLTPIVRKASHASHYRFTQEDWNHLRQSEAPVWLLYHMEQVDWEPEHDTSQAMTRETGETMQSPLSEYTQDTVNTSQNSSQGRSIAPITIQKQVIPYLKYGMVKENPVHETYVSQHRSPWYVVEQQEPPEIFYTSMSRGSGRFIENTANVRILNNLYGISLTGEFSSEERSALLAYLNTEYVGQVLKHAGRTLSSGMRKLEPSSVSSLPVIDPRELPNETVTTLATQFDALCNARRSDDATREHRIKQDILQCLNDVLTIELNTESKP